MLRWTAFHHRSGNRRLAKIVLRPFVRLSLKIYVKTANVTASVDIRPLVSHFRVVFQLDRQIVPPAIARYLEMTNIDLSYAAQGLPSTIEDIHQNLASLAACCSELGNAHFDRYLHVGSVDGVNLHWSYAALALALTVDSLGDKAHVLHNLGIALVAHFR